MKHVITATVGGIDIKIVVESADATQANTMRAAVCRKLYDASDSGTMTEFKVVTT